MQLQKNTKNKRWSRALLVCSAAGLLLVLGDVILIGNLSYYAKWMTCKNQPLELVEIRRFGNNTLRYYQPTQPTPSLRGSMRTYFCTAEQAEASGLESREALLADPKLNNPTRQLILEGK